MHSLAHPLSLRDCCPRCGRPRPSCCLCAALPPAALDLRTRVVVLQHPKEVHKGIGTVQLLRPLLARLSIQPVLSGAESLVADAIAGDDGGVALLLYPAPNAIALDEPDGLRRLHELTAGAARRGVTLVAVDGTWRQAKSLFERCAAQLQPLQPVCFRHARPAPRVYHGLRREPGEAALSTLESIAAALALIEADARLEAAMTAPLSLLVAQQLAFSRSHAQDDERRVRVRSTAAPRATAGAPVVAGGAGVEPRVLSAIAAGGALLGRAERQLRGWREVTNGTSAGAAAGYQAAAAQAAARHVALWDGTECAPPPLGAHARAFARRLSAWHTESAALLAAPPPGATADELRALARLSERWAAHVREARAFVDPFGSETKPSG